MKEFEGIYHISLLQTTDAVKIYKKSGREEFKFYLARTHNKTTD